MNVTVVSRDRELYRLCREILAEVTKQTWTISIGEPEAPSGDADLYLWDFHTEPIPELKESATH